VQLTNPRPLDPAPAPVKLSRPVALSRIERTLLRRGIADRMSDALEVPGEPSLLFWGLRRDLVGNPTVRLCEAEVMMLSGQLNYAAERATGADREALEALARRWRRRVDALPFGRPLRPGERTERPLQPATRGGSDGRRKQRRF
jgi:hypothetical protein